MEDLMLSESEYRLMDVIWKHAPIESGKLVKVCESELNWKKSTTYTMLRKLIVKQMVSNTDSLVTVLIPRDQVQMFESRRVVKRTFGGSLPSFLLSFLEDRSLSDKEADELIKIIEEYRKEK